MKNKYLDFLLGSQEPTLTMTTGAVAEPIAGWAGILGGADKVDKVRNALTYQPRTETGQRTMDALGTVAQQVMETKPVQDYMAMTNDIGEHDPLAGSIFAALPTAAGMALPAAGGLGKKAMSQALKGELGGPVGKSSQKGIFRPLDSSDPRVALAELLKKEGVSDEDIWDSLQLRKFHDNMPWVDEIPDYLARVVTAQGGQFSEGGMGKQNFSHVLHHPGLEGDEFKWARDLPTSTERSANGTIEAAFWPQHTFPETHQKFVPDGAMTIIAPDNESLRSTALHEMQHAFQEKYGIPTGADPDYIKNQTVAALKEGNFAGLPPKLIKAQESYDKAGRFTKALRSNDLEAALDAHSRMKYVANPGEAMARLVQLRENMPPELLRKNMPRLEDAMAPEVIGKFGVNSRRPVAVDWLQAYPE